MKPKAARIYDNYDVTNPPEHPGPEWTRFVCISDTHSRTYDVPPGDVLLHSGDLCSWGYLSQLEVTLKWLQELPHSVKIIIAGNHDMCLDKNWDTNGSTYLAYGRGMPSYEVPKTRNLIRSEAMKECNIHYLEYESMRFTTASGRTWEVYGSPAVPLYALGAFQYEKSEEAEEIFAKIPSSTEILLTHTPPRGTLDKTKRGVHAGCPVLAARLESEDLKRCRLHVFGHIHESGGGGVMTGNKVAVNAAMPQSRIPLIVDLLN